MANFKGEKLIRDNQTRLLYHYIDDEKKINRISKEIYKKRDLEIHYPWGLNGDVKYKTLQKISFLNFKGKLPVGVYKNNRYGYGFTKKLFPFVSLINNEFEIEEVIIEKGGVARLDLANKKLYFSEKNLQLIHDSLSKVFEKHRKESDHILRVSLNSIFPHEIPLPASSYIKNALSTSLSTWGNSIEEFSNDDKKAIKDLFDKLSMDTDFLTGESLSKTKELIDTKYIRNTLTEYKELMKLKTSGDLLEKKWQKFLNKNSWLFSYIFTEPVILYEAEAYVGGKSLDNRGGKVTDFLIKNGLSDNISFLEIKTHKTPLLEKRAYRGGDVFGASKELSGCIGQVLNQRQNFQQEFLIFARKSKTKIESLNPKCVVLIGSFSDLANNQISSFELYRRNSRDVDIITFDELQHKIEHLLNITSLEKGNKKKKK